MQRITGGTFIQGDEATNTLGSPVDAPWLQTIQEEVGGFVEATGQVLNPNDNAQLAKGIQSGKVVTANAGGTADAITASFTPAILTLTHNMVLYVRAAAANATTGTTFTPNAGLPIAAAGIYKGANSSIEIGDVAGTGHCLKLRFDVPLTKWELLNPARGIAVSTLANDATLADNGTKPVSANWVRGATLGASLSGYASPGNTFGTTYTNTNGRTIDVSVTAQTFAATSSGFSVTVNGLIIGYYYSPVSTGGTGTVTVRVPNGATYRADWIGGAGSNVTWRNL